VFYPANESPMELEAHHVRKPGNCRVPGCLPWATNVAHGTNSLYRVQRQTLGKNETHNKMAILPRATLGEEKALSLTLVVVNCSQRCQLLPWVSTQHSTK